MKCPPILNISSSDPKTIGEAHGEALRDKIQEIFEIRLDRIMTEPQFNHQDEVIDLCRQHLPILQRFDQGLHTELMGIADASHLAPEAIVLINHYTDIRDIGHPSDSEGECTAIYIPGENGPMLGQTWDIHGTAKDYVAILHIQMGGYHCAIFTIAGCLGMTGISNNGMGVCINNLNSMDAKVGVIWPAMVRRILKQKTATDAKNLIQSSPFSSGRYYGIADANSYCGLEVSGTKTVDIHDDPSKINFHTNHCLDPEMEQLHRIRTGSSTFDRYQTIEDYSGPLPENLDNLYDLFCKVSIAPTPQQPNATTTCGAMLMNIKSQTYLPILGHLGTRDSRNPVRLQTV